MKHYFKKLPVYLYICAALIAYSCSEERDFTKEENRISTVNLKDLPFLQKELNKDKRKGSFSKECLTYYLDKINTQNIIQIIDKYGLKNYTFAMNYRTTDTIYNLCAKEKGGGEYTYSLIKYSSLNIDQWIEDIKNTNLSPINPDIKADLLLESRTMNLPCISVLLTCPSGQHNSVNPYGCQFVDMSAWTFAVTISADCFGGIGNGGPYNDGNNNTGPEPTTPPINPPANNGSSGPSNSGNTIGTTTPNVEDEDPLGAPSPCNKIKKQMAKFPTIKQSLLDLKSTVSQNHENGIFVDKTATPISSNIIQTIPNLTTIGGVINLNMNPISKYIMIAHTHDSYGPAGVGTFSIFSWDDLTTINNLIKNNHIDNSEFVFYVVTADNTRYALTIDNSTDLSNFFYNPSPVFGEPVDTAKLFQMDKVFRKYYDGSLITTTSDKDTDKISFLNFIKEANLGVSIFEVDETFTNFEKLSLDNSGDVKKTPCNN